MKAIRMLFLFALFSLSMLAPAYADIIAEPETYITPGDMLSILAVGVALIAVVIIAKLIKKKR